MRHPFIGPPTPSPDPRIAAGMRLLRERQWYAAHEAIEAAWLDAGGDERAVLQCVIHVAVAFEHLRRGNARGALSQWRKAQAKLGRIAPPPLGIDLAAWIAAVGAFFARIDLEGRAAAPRAAALAPLPAEDTWPVPPQ